MSGEQAKIRSQEIRESLQNAVEAGCIADPPINLYGGVTFQVDEDQNLLLLDGNKLITIPDITTIVENVKNFQSAIDACSTTALPVDTEAGLLSVLDGIDDAGLILVKCQSESVTLLDFLRDQFQSTFPQNHHNFKEWTALYQVFLDLIFFRRQKRVMRYIEGNTKKFEGDSKLEIESMEQAAHSRLNTIRDHLKLCKQKCDECFYPCLLQMNHEEDKEWPEKHSCRQSDHTCRQQCDYCLKNKKEIQCGLKSGHKGAHNCKQENHTCGKDCSLKQYGGCQLDCSLKSSHEGDCKCAAETHFCKEVCGVGICKNPCQVPYTKPHTDHICIQRNCPYKCEVLCWNDALQKITECGRPCASQDHDHVLKMKRGECKDEGHTCDETHPCPHLCTEIGICKVEVLRKVVEKATFVTGAGDTIEYDAYAECNAEKERCAQRIPVGRFSHDGDDHKCFAEGKKTHTCEERCDTCGYYCDKEIGHYERDGSFHDCVHGNMRNTIFYATEEIVDTGANRKYRVGDSGTAEMCNIFCERQGRGHIHLELCDYAKEGNECVEEEGRRHQTMPVCVYIFRRKLSDFLCMFASSVYAQSGNGKGRGETFQILEEKKVEGSVP